MLKGLRSSTSSFLRSANVPYGTRHRIIHLHLGCKHVYFFCHLWGAKLFSNTPPFLSSIEAWEASTTTTSEGCVWRISKMQPFIQTPESMKSSLLCEQTGACSTLPFPLLFIYIRSSSSTKALWSVAMTSTTVLYVSEASNPLIAASLQRCSQYQAWIHDSPVKHRESNLPVRASMSSPSYLRMKMTGGWRERAGTGLARRGHSKGRVFFRFRFSACFEYNY